jgi:hypothetical protein
VVAAKDLLDHALRKRSMHCVIALRNVLSDATEASMRLALAFS